MENNLQDREIAVKLSGVKKMYKLGQIGGGTLHGDLESWWARIRGKEDPNTLVGTNQRLYGKTFMALNGIDLTFYKGEAIGIIGGNGAGKSTMLKLLSRITAPTVGCIDLYGRVASMLEVGTGFHGELTGRENVYMNGAILGMTKAEIDAKMEDIIEFSEVRDFIDTPVKRYSSGMYVKLASAVAVHLDSEIMIMDEVLAVGDMAFQKKCLNKMREAAQKEGRTVLYVSHNMSTIRQLCDRCVVLSKGKVIFDGDVETAIGVYMENEEENTPKMQCADMNRPAWVIGQKINVSLVEYLQKDCIEFLDDEPILLHFQWTNLSPVNNIGVLIEICSLDDVPQATFDIYEIYSGAEGEKGDVVIKLNIGSLMDGSYRMRYTFFEKVGLGTGSTIDYVPGLCFRKMTTNKGDRLNWITKQWGYIRMPKAEVISVSKNP